jgi:cellulose synthase/poly-beta-1,6-N-acetylglucosamine synthase-like glycosyltransferase
MIRCTVGVLAHNEAHNIVRALHALLAQEMREHAIEEIIVIASGCTDATVALAEGVASSFPIVKVEVETERSGKATAIRRLTARARGVVIVMVGADTLPERTAIEHLLQPFTNPRVGMTGGRIIPLNAPTTWQGFAVQMLWHVHHQLAESSSRSATSSTISRATRRPTNRRSRRSSPPRATRWLTRRKPSSTTAVRKARRSL